MAIRYSGDAEVRVRWDAKRRLYWGSVADPNYHWRGVLPAHKLRRRVGANPEAYDQVARYFFEQAHLTYPRLRIETKMGIVEVRRVYQAPCPAGPARGPYR